MNQDLLNLLKQRRSIYALGNDIKQNPDELVALIESVIQETPTAFNSQATRAVFLFGEQHDKLWDIVVKRLKSEVPSEEAYEATKKKIAGFKAVTFSQINGLINRCSFRHCFFITNFI